MGHKHSKITIPSKENPIIPKERKYIWIDPSIYNEPNLYYYEVLFIKNNINCKRYLNIDEAFNYVTKKQNEYKEIVIIISGKLFNDFYYAVKNNIDEINFSPTIIVFTTKDDLFINQLKRNNIYYNNDLFDTKYIFTKKNQIEDFINNKIPEENDVTFDLIDNLDQLIVPNYYSYLLEDVNIHEIKNFNNYIKNKFLPPSEEEMKILSEEGDNKLLNKMGNKNIQKHVSQLINEKRPKILIIKYWLRMYSFQSEFYNTLNKSLRNKDPEASNFYPFIKLCYEGIKKGYLQSYNKEIYRCSKINIKEFNKIQRRFNANTKSEIPKIIVFSRSFLSFSMDKDRALGFKGGADEITFSILYIVEEIPNYKNTENKVSNAVIDRVSANKAEKEVLVFPLTCFEIVNIKESKNSGINYEISLKYLGNYSNYIKEQFGTNFFDKIQISNFSQELIDSGIVNITNFFSTWEQRKEIKIKLDKICFLSNIEGDCIGFAKNEIIIFNINSSKIKQKINIHNDQILDIVKLKYNRICSCSKDRTIRIIQLSENNRKYIELNNIYLYNYYAVQLKFLFNENIVFTDNINNISFFSLKDNKYNYEDHIKEENCILIIKELYNNKLVYITENKKGNKLIKFIDLKNRIKEENNIKIDEKDQKLKVIDLLIFYDYILISYDHRIDIINYQKRPFNLRSLKYFDFEITNMIVLSSNRIILGLYDSNKKESFIRDHLLRIEDLQNNLDKFDCIGQGNLENVKNENIIKINESQILINIKNNACAIYERKNEVSDSLQKNLMAINNNEKLQEKHYNNNIFNNRNKNFKEEEEKNCEYIPYKNLTSFPNYPQINNAFWNKNSFYNQIKKNNQQVNNNINTNNVNNNPFFGIMGNKNYNQDIENFLPKANTEELKENKNENYIKEFSMKSMKINA